MVKKIVQTTKNTKNPKNKNNTDDNQINSENENINKILKSLKGGLKSVDEANEVDEEDYSTDDGENDEIDEKEEEDKVKDEEESENELEEKEEEEEDEEEEEEEEEEEKEEEVAEVGEDGEVDCVYRFTGKKKNKDALDFKVEDDFFEEEDKKLPIFVDNDKRITKKFMTIYERVRLLGVRAKQLSLGAKPMIRNAENQDPKTIAKLELENKVMPLIIIRTLPNGQKEKWKVSELDIIN